MCGTEEDLGASDAINGGNPREFSFKFSMVVYRDIIDDKMKLKKKN